MLPNTLPEYLRHYIDAQGWSLRDAEAQLGVSRAALSNILTNAEVTPRLDTLEQLATALNLPLWKMIELAGFDLDLTTTPEDKAARLLSLARRQPAYQPIVDHLLDLHPDDLEGVLVYLEAAELRRKRLYGEQSG